MYEDEVGGAVPKWSEWRARGHSQSPPALCLNGQVGPHVGLALPKIVVI